jgi:hypothetical protein
VIVADQGERGQRDVALAAASIAYAHDTDLRARLLDFLHDLRLLRGGVEGLEAKRDLHAGLYGRPDARREPIVVFPLFLHGCVKDHSARLLTRERVQNLREFYAEATRFPSGPSVQGQRYDPQFFVERHVRQPIAEPHHSMLKPDVDLVEELRPRDEEQHHREDGYQEGRALDEPNPESRIGAAHRPG